MPVADPHAADLRALLERFVRVAAADDRAMQLNPAQAAALAYLSRANRFSRAPSHVADYLGATRGTVSQTLKALGRKGLISESRSATDRRAIRYDVTPAGAAALSHDRVVDDAIGDLSAVERAALEATITKALRTLLDRRGAKPFGVCRSCRHHDAGGDVARCRLLAIDLARDETDQICHEFDGGAPA